MNHSRLYSKYNRAGDLGICLKSLHTYTLNIHIRIEGDLIFVDVHCKFANAT